MYKRTDAKICFDKEKQRRDSREYRETAWRDIVLHSSKVKTLFWATLFSCFVLLIASMLFFGIRAMVLYTEGPYMPQNIIEWMIVIFSMPVPFLAMFGLVLMMREIISLLRDFHGSIEMRRDRLVYSSRYNRLEIMWQDLVEIRSFGNKLSRRTYTFISQHGEKFTVDTRYDGINDIVKEAIKQIGTPDEKRTTDRMGYGWTVRRHRGE